MPDSEKDIERLEQEIPLLANAAVHEAYERALKNGSVYVSGQDGGWTGVLEVFPDGRRVRVKPIDPPTHVPVGTQAQIP